MFRLWGKIFNENRMIQDYVYENDDYKINRTKKVFDGLEDICHTFDLAVPMWLDLNIDEFKRIDKTRFTNDNFVDPIDFDYLQRTTYNIILHYLVYPFFAFIKASMLFGGLVSVCHVKSSQGLVLLSFQQYTCTQ